MITPFSLPYRINFVSESHHNWPPGFCAGPSRRNNNRSCVYEEYLRTICAKEKESVRTRAQRAHASCELLCRQRLSGRNGISVALVRDPLDNRYELCAHPVSITSQTELADQEVNTILQFRSICF